MVEHVVWMQVEGLRQQTTDDRCLSASSFAISATFSAVHSATYDRMLAESFEVSPVNSA
jgi:hypothetical protein